MRVAKDMTEFTFPFLTQIFGVESEGTGKYIGSGTLLDLGGVPYLISAAHVPSSATASNWAHSVDNGEPPKVVPNPWQCLGAPEDLAIARLDGDHFRGQYRARALDPSLLAVDSNDLDGDYLFIHGWPGQFSKEVRTIGNGIASKPFPYLTGVGSSSDPAFDGKMHLAVDFRMDGKYENGRSASPPDPGGMSGSAVWRTNWKSRGASWTFHDARVIGIINGWDQANHSLTCTRIEVIRSFINFSLHREAAYLNWLGRKCPASDDWSDWLSVKPYRI